MVWDLNTRDLFPPRRMLGYLVALGGRTGLPFPKLTAEEAAAQFRHGQTVVFSAFTVAGSPKAKPSAIARKPRLPSTRRTIQDRRS